MVCFARLLHLSIRLLWFWLTIQQSHSSQLLHCYRHAMHPPASCAECSALECNYMFARAHAITWTLFPLSRALHAIRVMHCSCAR